MSDPLTQVIELMRPRAIFSKSITGAGPWAVRYSAFGQPGFCAVLEGRCRLMVDGEEPATLEQGDFVLLPATPAFTMSGFEPVIPTQLDPRSASSTAGEVRHGRANGPAEVRLLGGYFAFDTPDAALLVSLLPSMIHIRGVERLTTLVRLVAEEAQAENVGRELVLTRLAEILLIEALRMSGSKDTPPGLLHGLSDVRVAKALRDMHGDPQRTWTVIELADVAGMSRSAFFDRFTRAVGLRPMEYLMAWRMAVAKDMLRHDDLPLDEVARRVGYGSASTFSTAFSRHVGQPPGRYARTQPS
ncbi:cupin domain-containing protein [Nitrobacter sp. TKz-YC02]|uniref:AraC family transcriptional regulator n=1 Tax=Nitrobacter sp. TKz-YC02 TaxID=3398704 RepID=UPI003CF4F716